MALAAAVLLPLWLIVGSCMALSSGFCSDWADEATCAAQRRSNGITAAVGFVLIALLLVAGLVRAHRNRPETVAAPVPLRSGDRASRPRNRKAVAAMVLSLLGWLLPGIDTSTAASLLLWLTIAVVGPLPALVLAWRARTEIRAPGAHQSGLWLAWTATVVASGLVALGVVTFLDG